jgi:hypothetical protein
MKLTLVAIAIAIVAGLLTGGRLSNLASARIRWSALALVGLALQVVPVPGHGLSFGLLFLSFGILLVFAMANVRLPGFALILLGLAMNFSVIAANGGMPVTRSALVASDQQGTLELLVHDGGAKHHLAGGSDVLLPLADVIPLHGLDQAVSPGDIATCGGVIWLVVWCMRRRDAASIPSPRRRSVEPEAVRVGS